jgi:hypothetical protein
MITDPTSVKKKSIYEALILRDRPPQKTNIINIGIRTLSKKTKKKNKSTERKAKKSKPSKTRKHTQRDFEKKRVFQEPRIQRGISKAVRYMKTRPRPSRPKTIFKFKTGKSTIEYKN